MYLLKRLTSPFARTWIGWMRITYLSNFKKILHMIIITISRIIPGTIDVLWNQCALCCGAGLRFFKIKYLVKVRQVWICKKNYLFFTTFHERLVFVLLFFFETPAQVFVLKACLTLSFFIQQISRTESKGLWKYIFQKGK